MAIPWSPVHSTILRNLRKWINITIIPRHAVYGERNSSSMAKENKPIHCWDRTACILLFFLCWQTLTFCKILEVAQGIAYIHSEGVVHGDIRGVFYLKHSMLRYWLSFQTNILLDANRHVQIAGFGLARISEDLDNPSGAIHFSAPELFGFPEDVQQMAKTYKSDVYAFGCLYYEVSNNKHLVLFLRK